MDKTTSILRVSLFCGTLYFLGVSAAHMSGVKIPFLYIYFNIPSTMYQDRIISVLSFGWCMFFFFAWLNPARIKIFLKPILSAGAIALLGLALINSTTDFNTLSPAATPHIYWVQWVVLLCYFCWLLIVALYTKHIEQSPNEPLQSRRRV